MIASIDNPMLQAALGYAAHGWHVFPLKPGTKFPFKGTNGFKGAMTDPETIKAFWSTTPDANIGIATGASELVVLDGDIKHGGNPVESLMALGMPPETLRAATPSQGWHLYFGASEGIEVRDSASKIGPDLDVRGEGGYVVAPPSVVEGKPYRWINGPDEPVAPLPTWLAEICAAPPKNTQRDTQREQQVGDAIPSGTRNSTLTSLAGTMRRRGMTPAAIEAALTVENRERCRPPLGEEEVRKIAKSVGRYRPSEPAGVLKQLLRDFRQQDDPFLLTAALEKAGAPHYLVEGMLRRGDFVALMGHANGGKTAVGLDLALRLATGAKLLDKRTARCRVLYIASENPDEVVLRIRAWCLEHGTEPKELDGWFHIITRNFDLGNDEGAKWLAKQMLGYAGDFGCLFVDTFSSNFAGEDENSAANLMAWINCVRNNLMEPTGCSLVVMHHPPKNSDDVHNWRGSGAVKGAVDATWGVTNDGGTVTLEQGKRRGPPFAPINWSLQEREVPGLEDNFGNPAATVIALPTALTPAGVDVMWGEILLCLNEDGAMSNRRIGERCGIHHPKVAKEITKMKKEGLLWEKMEKKYITQAGRELMAIVEKNKPLLFP